MAETHSYFYNVLISDDYERHTYIPRFGRQAPAQRQGRVSWPTLKERNIGAIIWTSPGPVSIMCLEIVHHSLEKDKTRVARVTGLYACGDGLWLIEEDRSPVSVDAFYNPGSEVRAYGGYALLPTRPASNSAIRRAWRASRFRKPGGMAHRRRLLFRGLGGMRLR